MGVAPLKGEVQTKSDSDDCLCTIFLYAHSFSALKKLPKLRAWYMKKLPGLENKILRIFQIFVLPDNNSNITANFQDIVQTLFKKASGKASKQKE